MHKKSAKPGSCGCTHESTGDGMEAATDKRVLDRDPVSWLAGRAVRYLHAANPEEEAAFAHSIELLRRIPEATGVLAQAIHEIRRDDASLRWALLYVLAEVGDSRSAEVFMKVAAEPVPAHDRSARGCETAHDGEVLVRTMAIAGLQRVAAKHEAAVEMLYGLLQVQPERALRIEAVKALLALAPGSKERIKELLPAELHFALEIKRVRAEALAVEHAPEQPESVRVAPVLGAVRRSPDASNYCRCS